jgi:hypothetical protein
MVARIKVVKLYTLGKKLSLNIVCERKRVIPGLVLQLIYIVISYILVGGACYGIMMLHETEKPRVVEAGLGELSQVRGEVLELEHVHGIQSV